MASTVYFLVFAGFIFAFSQSVTSQESNEWDVERSSVNPLSYTDEDHYSRDWTPEIPVQRSSQNSWNCLENEHFSLCEASCQTTCDNYNKTIPCRRLCVMGCVCDLELVRGSGRKCIKPEECPDKAQDDIGKWDEERSSVNPPSYTDEDQYSRDRTTENPVQESFQLRWNCSENEHFTNCDGYCQKTCDNPNNPSNCQRYCLMGCVCDSGLVRGPDRKCIKLEECPKKARADVGKWDEERSSVNPPSYTDEDQYSREKTTENPVQESLQLRLNCSENEHFTSCDGYCQKTCDNPNTPSNCQKYCLMGCVCDSGLVRGPDRKCIKPEECPRKARADVGKNYLIDVEKSQYEEPEITPNSEKKHPPASKSNILRFPIPLICKRGEKFDPCTRNCPYDCNNFRGNATKCFTLCMPSCVCIDGLVRNPDGKCTKPEECPKEKYFCPDGEEYSPSQAHCEGDCVKGEDNKNNCNTRLTVPGCTCKNGLVRGPEGTCIYYTNCPTTPPTEPPTKVCPENEQYNDTKAACQWNCSNIDSAISCPPIPQAGCVCEESFIRGKYGKCIATDECPKDNSPQDSYITLNHLHNTAGDNRIPYSEQYPQTTKPKSSHRCPPKHRWVPCSSHCQRNCSNKDDKDFECRLVCIPGCICEEGLVRGPDGECIEKDKCPPKSDSEGDQIPFICGRNATRELRPPRCPDDCDNYKDKDRECLRERLLIPACICKKGLVRGPDENCIEPDKCPKKDCEREEMYSMCNANCEKNCSNWADDMICPKACVPGCVCRPGLIRGPAGKCIIWSKCPVNPGNAPTETPSPIDSKVSEITRLNVLENAGCPNDNKCTVSCRHYGHRYGHCTGRNSLLCSCFIEKEENDE